MARVLFVRLAVLGAIAAALLACNKKKKPTVDDTKVTVSSTEDATNDLIDEDYRVRIRWPGKGWKLLGETDMRQISADAIAGAVSDQHVWAAVIIERFSDGDFKAFARRIIDNMPLEGKEIEEETEVEFAGESGALRFVVSGRISGMDARYVSVIFSHEKHVYQVMSWSQKDVLDRAGTRAQPFFDAFSLLDGPVSGRQQLIASHDTQGPGWRLRSGVFESAVHKLRIEPPAGWHVAVGTELANMNADAEVALVHSNPDLYITVLAERSSASPEEEKDLQKLTRTSVEKAFEITTRGQPLDLAMADKMRVFDRTMVADPPFEFLTTSFLHGGEWFQIQAWYLAALEDREKELIRAGLTAIEFLGPDAASALRAELISAVDSQNTVGQDFSLRRGTYRDFEHQFTWRAPEGGFWRIAVGQAARAIQRDARLSAEEAETSIYLRVTTSNQDGLSLPEYVNTVIRDADRTISLSEKQRLITLGDLDAVMLTGDAVLRNGAMAEYRILVAVGPSGVGLRADAWGIVEQMRQHGDMVEKALTNFRFDSSLRSTVGAGDLFTDMRMGYSLRMGPEWQREMKTPDSLASLGSATLWKNDRRNVFILSLCALDVSHDEEWFFDFMEQRVRENLGALIAGEPDKTTVEIGGEPARQLVWKTGRERVYAFLARRDATLYMIMGSNLTDGEAEAMRAQVTFLD